MSDSHNDPPSNGDDLSVYREALVSAEAQLEGQYPGMHEVIVELGYSSFGRAIVLRSEKQRPAPQNTEQAIISLAAGQQREYEDRPAGYILPLNADQTSHIVVFDNGHMYRLQSDDLHGQSRYEEYFAPNEYPLILRADTTGSAEHHLLHGNWSPHDTKAVISNTDPQHVEDMRNAVRQAIEVARELKRRRDEAVSGVADQFIQEFGDLLNPRKPERPRESGTE